jgi:hypothetical protein
MKTLLAIAVFLLLVPPGFGQNVVVPSYAFGKRYSSEIPNETLEKSPSWNMQSDSPPLAPGKAIRLANVLRAKLVKDSARFKWRCVSATLDFSLAWLCADDAVMRDKCWWQIRYEAHGPEGGEIGEIYQNHHLIIIVLMNGTVIEPKVSDFVIGS